MNVKSCLQQAEIRPIVRVTIVGSGKRGLWQARANLPRRAWPYSSGYLKELLYTPSVTDDHIALEQHSDMRLSTQEASCRDPQTERGGQVDVLGCSIKESWQHPSRWLSENKSKVWRVALSAVTTISRINVMVDTKSMPFSACLSHHSITALPRNPSSHSPCATSWCCSRSTPHTRRWIGFTTRLSRGTLCQSSPSII